MLDNKLRYIILKYCESKANLTELDKDILDSCNDLYKNSIDRNAIIQRIITNRTKYFSLLQEEYIAHSIKQGQLTTPIPWDKLSDMDLQNNLQTQISVLLSKIQ